ncbi:hypothetical protein SK128_026328, partial [Halocaridina rubra]
MATCQHQSLVYTIFLTGITLCLALGNNKHHLNDNEQQTAQLPVKNDNIHVQKGVSEPAKIHWHYSSPEKQNNNNSEEELENSKSEQKLDKLKSKLEKRDRPNSKSDVINRGLLITFRFYVKTKTSLIKRGPEHSYTDDTEENVHARTETVEGGEEADKSIHKPKKIMKSSTQQIKTEMCHASVEGEEETDPTEAYMSERKESIAQEEKKFQGLKTPYTTFLKNKRPTSSVMKKPQVGDTEKILEKINTYARNCCCNNAKGLDEDFASAIATMAMTLTKNHLHLVFPVIP